ncbi:MAG: phosphate acyltransferase [Eubacteriales bacterium]|nr:phosphate acyltransferase [Eubacteriales bacterium]MDD4324100.1 phosphate acyltransferase [Eubacteriales bacterium]MDD4541475.1 phosphate acyltransferase [Eubacteriales bacterium]
MGKFDVYHERARALASKAVIAVVVPDQHSLDAIEAAIAQDLASAAFFMTTKTEQSILDKVRNSQYSYYVLDSAEEAAEYAVAATAAGECQMLMKGNLDTAVLLRAILKKGSGLTTGKLLTHLAWLDMPSYHKIFILTDGGMIPYPTVEEKEEILKHAVNYSHRLGLEEPKVAVLAAAEKVNPKLKETTDAAYLKEQALSGKYGKCIVEGPISFDLAYVPDAAEIKGYSSPVAGDADILLVPDLVSGNLLAKGLVFGGGGEMAGLIVGAKVPILLISRSASAKEKMNTIAMAVVLSQTTDEEENR